jgi:hypothetical protein
LDFDHVFLSIVEPFNNDAAYATVAVAIIPKSSTPAHFAAKAKTATTW